MLDADEGASGGSGKSDDKGDSDDATEGEDDAKKSSDKGGKKPAKPSLAELRSDPDIKTEMDDYISQQVKDRLERDRKKREEDALAEQKKFEDLAEKRAATISDLESKVEESGARIAELESELEAASGVVETLVNQMKEGLETSVTELLDGRPLTEQLDWLTKHAKDSKKAKADGIPPSPKGDNPDPALKKKRAEEAQTAAARTYRSMF